MLSRDVTSYPDGAMMPLPAPPAVMASAEPAGPGTSGMALSRVAGRQHTLTLTGPCGAGDLGYMGRDISDPATDPVPEGHGIFARLHHEARGE